MGEPVRILHAEDDTGFAELVETFLERELPRASVHHAESTDEAGTILASEDIDCIVSDYDMPGRTGIEFLEDVRSAHPDLPFILFTGKGSEAVASEAISKGVTDYLQKRSGTEQYELLANKIVNAVSEYRAREFEQVAKHSPMRLLDRLFDGFITLDTDWCVVYANDEALEIFGRSDGELIGENIWEVFPEARDTPFHDRYHEAMETAEPTTIEEYFEPWDRWYREHLYPSDEGLSVLFRDITERKRRERDLRERAKELTAIHETTKAFESIEVPLERAIEEFVEILPRSFQYPDRTEARIVYDGEEVSTANYQPSEHTIASQTDVDGDDEVRVEVVYVGEWDGEGEGPFVEEERRLLDTLLAVVANNIVRRESVEEVKRNRDLLTDTEQLARTGGWEADVGSGEQRWTDGTFAIHDLDPDDDHDPTVASGIAFYHPDDRETIREAVERCVEDGEPWELELRLVSADDRLKWVRTTGEPVRDDGDIVRMRGAIQDITALKERARELERERAFIDESLDALQDVFYVLDEEGELVRWNSRIAEVTGYAGDEIAESNPLALFHEEHRPRVSESIQRTFETGADTVRADVVTRDGERVPYEFRGTLLDDVAGDGDAMAGVGRDISAQVRRERELGRYETLIEETTDVIIIVDEDGDFDYVSPAAAEVLGYPPERLVGENGFDYVHPDDREETMERFFGMVADPAVRPSVEFRFERGDGSWVWLEARGRNLLDYQYIQGLVIYARDVTARKDREQELQRYASLFEHASDAIALATYDDEAPIVQEVNEAFRSTFAPDEPLEGRNIDEIVASDERRTDASEISQRVREGDFAREELTRDAVDGPRDFLWQRIPVEDTETGEIESAFAIYTDISERTAHERELERQNARLEEFSNVVSHDLRNPLNVAEGRLELAMEECESEHLAPLERSLDRMETLIDDLLTLAREGSQVSDFASVDLASLLADCWTQVETNDATLRMELDGTVMADESRLKQLFENLIGNAIEHGGDDVTITVGDLEDGFYIEDDGPGISPERRDDVFSPGFSTKDGGTGFGLSIVKQIADAHDWEVRLTEGESGGARFGFTNVEFDG